MFTQRPRAATAPASSANAKATTGSPIKVAIRIRPLCTASPGTPLSLMARTSCIAAESATSISFTPTASNSGNIGLRDKSSGMTRHPVHYAFDATANQADIFNTAVKPLLAEFAAGHNVAIMAYGQTGSGKTHTMGMAATPFKVSDASAGVVPRALKWLFSQASAPKVKASFVELYNGELRDLANGMVPVASATAAMAVLNAGLRVRRAASTRSNATSSRSHAVFTVTVSWPGQRGQTKLRFVDLAGSERLEKTQAVGTRRDEGVAINKSLLALRNVISALAQPTLHSNVPYRDDALTKLLRDSVGGEAKTLLLACVAGDAAHASETSNTLDFAKHAIHVKRRVSVGPQVRTLGTAAEEAQKRMAAEAKVEQFQAKVEQLQAHISRLEAENSRLKLQTANLNQKTAWMRAANTKPATADMRIADARTATDGMRTRKFGNDAPGVLTADSWIYVAGARTTSAGTDTDDFRTADAGTATDDMRTREFGNDAPGFLTVHSWINVAGARTTSTGTDTDDFRTADAGTATTGTSTADAGTDASGIRTAGARTATAGLRTAGAGTATIRTSTAGTGYVTTGMRTADAGTAITGMRTAGTGTAIAGLRTAGTGTAITGTRTAGAGTATTSTSTAGAGYITTGMRTADAGTDASGIRTADAGTNAVVVGPTDAGTNAMVVGPTDAGTNAAKIRSADAGTDASGVRSTGAGIQAGAAVERPNKPTMLVRKVKAVNSAQSADAAEGNAAKCPKPAKLARRPINKLTLKLHVFSHFY